LFGLPSVGAASAAHVALDHGFQTALYGLTGLLLLGALITVTLVRSTPARKEHAQPVDGEVVALEEAA
jgi:hypothetical protein